MALISNARPCPSDASNIVRKVDPFSLSILRVFTSLRLRCLSYGLILSVSIHLHSNTFALCEDISLPMIARSFCRLLFERLGRGSAPAVFLLFVFFGFLPSVMAQQSEPQADRQAPQQSGMSTSAARPAVKDAKNRPITAGGFVDGAPVVFVDATHLSWVLQYSYQTK